MQTQLFDEADPDHCIHHKIEGGSLFEFPHAISSTASLDYLALLIDSLPWRHDTIRIAGKSIPIPRLQCWMGEKHASYAYSGIQLDPIPWDPAVGEIKQRVETLSGEQFNSVLLNYYRDGRDSIAWHADDEQELGSNPTIAAVSLGAERLFELRQKRVETPEKYQLLLQTGSLLVMGNSFQNNWLHRIPKVKDLNKPRISLTFRQIQ
jgi:alkylated DNA repair dioxygenase AlkB